MDASNKTAIYGLLSLLQMWGREAQVAKNGSEVPKLKMVFNTSGRGRGTTPEQSSG
jgi:hypothetical protein